MNKPRYRRIASAPAPAGVRHSEPAAPGSALQSVTIDARQGESLAIEGRQVTLTLIEKRGREGDVQNDFRYGQVGISTTAMIKMFKGAKPENAPRSYVAEDVIKTMGPSIKR